MAMCNITLAMSDIIFLEHSKVKLYNILWVNLYDLSLMSCTVFALQH